jgi:hypothetical protein
MLECVAVILISIALIALVFGAATVDDWGAKCGDFWSAKCGDFWGAKAGDFWGAKAGDFWGARGDPEPHAVWRHDAEWPDWDWHRGAAVGPPDWELLATETPDCGWPPEDREARTASSLLHYLS